MTWRRGLALLAPLVIGAAALGYVLSSSHEDGDVRVSLRRLADGRNEATVQFRGDDGRWGERVRPELRFQPADAEPGRWLNSSPASPPEAAAGPLKLGMLLPFSGLGDGYWGNNAEPGFKLAVKHVNEAGGVFGQPVIYVREDTATDPVQAGIAARRLVREHGVTAIVGPLYSLVATGFGDYVPADLRVPFVMPGGASPAISELRDDDFLFRTIISDTFIADELAKLAHDEGHDDEIVAVHWTDSWGRHLLDHFESHFAGTVTKIAVTPHSSEEAAAAAEEAAASGIKALVMLTDVDDAKDFFRAAPADAFDYILLIQALRLTEVYEVNPELLEGAHGVDFIGKHVSEAEGHWEEQFTNEYGVAPSYVQREPYDAAAVLMLAAEYAGVNDGVAIRDALRTVSNPPGDRYPASRDGIRDALAAIRRGEDIDLDGEATSLDWDRNGDIVSAHIQIWRFREGEIEVIREFEDRIELE